MNSSDRALPYSGLQLDALRELANIGTGAATRPLNELLGRSIELDVPASHVVRLPDSFEQLGPSERIVCAAYTWLEGPAPAVLLLLAEPGDVERLTPGATWLELARVSAHAYARVAAQLTGIDFTPTEPGTVTDMLGAVLDGLVSVPASERDEILLLVTALAVPTLHVTMQLVLLPQPSSTARLLTALGLGPAAERDAR